MAIEAFPSDLTAAVIRAAATAARAGLFVANQGNLSVRDQSSGLIAITPHDYPYEEMLDADLVIVDPLGSRLSGRLEPSYDLPVHQTIYRLRPDVHAVIHTEPPYANALGVVGADLLPVTTTGLKSANGIVPVMEFRAVRDEAFARDMLELMGDRHGVVWGNHGLLVVGTTVAQALDRTLGIEFNAQVLAIARTMGEPRSLAYLDAAMVVA
jgi:L-fuculose-phosphate aldolase/L-ribulose-5-phosphate 4-epimerase